MNYSKCETGLVVAIDGSTATVEFKQTDGCKACGLCHTGEHSGEGDPHVMRLEVEAVPQLEVGQSVVVSNAVPSAWAGALLLFALPLVGLLIGVVIGTQQFDGELPAAGTGMVGLFVFLSGGFVVDRLMHRRQRAKPCIVSIAGESTANES